MIAIGIVQEVEDVIHLTADTTTTQHLKLRLTIVHPQVQVHRDAATAHHQIEAKSQKVKEPPDTRHRHPIQTRNAMIGK